MRVIAGEFRSRLLKSVPGEATRPTPDRLRESLFSVLAPRIEGAVFADLYAGTGAVGIEALSRGAASVIFVEKARPALDALRANLASLGVAERAHVVAAKATTFLTDLQADILFLDPPYALEREYRDCLRLLGERADAPSLVIVQHDRRLVLDSEYGALSRVRDLRQGDNVLSFYEPKA